MAIIVVGDDHDHAVSGGHDHGRHGHHHHADEDAADDDQHSRSASGFYSHFSLSKRVSIGYTHSMPAKNAGLRIRIERSLRERFVEACRNQDKPAAQVIREFMRHYVARNSPGPSANSAGNKKKGDHQREGKGKEKNR